ncbi:hypothetical protein JO972_04030 [Verrucomicrobiaceae bacterium 5K15]|uniref:Uncharacterized protein n=1 Tax=Oceaniferula flava TaxID=2800421 RepID=A0AAE2SBX8_9BACT|nr:hypothetical protein [Oceaniferula flavus]MBK1854109.1 hypothetical protein [Oceaniferula flavus]MBM1135415.1 hypothetical protein [Oceaniferula flavus]
MPPNYRIAEISDLIAGHKLTKDQEDYLTTLAELTSIYEENNVPHFPQLEPHETIADNIVHWATLRVPQLPYR